MLSQCPDLHGKEAAIDKIVERTLIQAKHYQTKIKPVGVPVGANLDSVFMLLF